MKKFFSPEVKIALVAVAGIVVLFFGMQFLKGLNLFSSDVRYQMQFDDINGLTLTTPVFANGYKVGIVKKSNTITRIRRRQYLLELISTRI